MPTPQGCSTVYCAEVNPNGNIPKSLIKFSADLQGKIVSNLKTYMINKRQKRGGKIFDFENGEGLIVGVSMEERKRMREEKMNPKKEEVKEIVREVVKEEESKTVEEVKEEVVEMKEEEQFEEEVIG